MTLALRGFGTAVPDTKVLQEESKQFAFMLACPSEEQASWLPNMYLGTEIKSRYVSFTRAEMRDALEGTNHEKSVFLPKGIPEDRGPTTAQRIQRYAQQAGPLALKAARRAAAQAGIPLARFTHLVTVSCTGFRAPGFDVDLINGMRLPRTVERTHVGYMGCHGALNGLRVANAIVSSDSKAVVLLCAVELCSLHYHYGWNPQKVVANALFADWAAALVGAADAPSNHEVWRVAASGSFVFPDSTDAMTWTVEDHGFGMTLSKEVPKLIASHLRPWMAQWLDKNGLAISDVRSWAIHPGGPKIVAAAEEALQLDREATRCSRDILAEYGNMSSPTVLFILERLRRHNARRPCVALGFGPGLTAEAALMR